MISDLKKNFRLYYAEKFFNNSSFFLPIYILFGVDYLGLSYLQAGSFFLVSWTFTIIFDFFGGSISDKFGKKRTYTIGTIVQISMLLPFLFSTSYILLLATSAIRGIGRALRSNSLDALIYDHAIIHNRKKEYQHANANAQIYVFLGRIYSSVIGGLAYLVHPTLPYLLTMLALSAALVSALLITDKGIAEHRDSEESHFTIMKQAMKLYGQKLGLLKFVVIGGLFALWADMLFGYYQPFYIDLGVSAATLGYIFSAISVFSAIGSYIMRKLPDKYSAHSIHSAMLIGVMVSASAMILTGIPIVYGAPMFTGVIFGFMHPNMRLYVNRMTPSRLRTSVLSFGSTVLNVGAGIGFLIALIFADHAPANLALSVIISGALITLLVNVYIHPKEG